MTNNSIKKTILLIDDDDDIVQTIKANLLVDGYNVITAFSGQEGIAMAKQTPPHLILLDLNLPDLDGIAVCEVLRKEFDFPIIMLTARDTLSDKVLGFKSGADDYIIKPFEFLELSARLTALFNRVDRVDIQYEQQFNDLGINFRTRQVTIKNKLIKLTKTEFELLVLFTSHKDKALSREFIEKQIWKDSELYANSRALDVHIQRLRKKIEHTPDSPEYIVTIPGVGYKFNVTNSLHL
ncbi:MAG: response regulator transcription factor [Desulfobacteraceae bacterium]|nr:response regulator transcription factor [Desulfobacteraceae bacterium]